MTSQRQRAMGGLLTLVQASGGQLESRIRLQKEAFLLAARGSQAFDPDDFIFHHYGPYSRPLSDLLQEAVAWGFVKEEKESFSDGSVRYSYRLTESGGELVRAAVSGDATIQEFAPKLQANHWRALELAATVAFLERKKVVGGREQAFEEAIRIKPACKKYSGEAAKVLETVGI